MLPTISPRATNHFRMCATHFPVLLFALGPLSFVATQSWRILVCVSNFGLLRFLTERARLRTDAHASRTWLHPRICSAAPLPDIHSNAVSLHCVLSSTTAFASRAPARLPSATEQATPPPHRTSAWRDSTLPRSVRFLCAKEATRTSASTAALALQETGKTRSALRRLSMTTTMKARILLGLSAQSTVSISSLSVVV